jgi:RimJ/RimL family protein N-acetyltransferase
MTINQRPLRTKRLTLRAFRPSDLDSAERYMLLEDVQQYLLFKTRDRLDCRDALAAMCRQVSLQRPGDMLTLAISLQATGEVIGHVSLHWTDAMAAQGEVICALAPAYRGRGYAAEAVQAVIDMAFAEFRLHRVFARCDARNHASVNLMKRLGFRLEAHFREHALYKGEWYDELHFAKLDREWDRGPKVKELTVHRVA